MNFILYYEETCVWLIGFVVQVNSIYVGLWDLCLQIKSQQLCKSDTWTASLIWLQSSQGENEWARNNGGLKLMMIMKRWKGEEIKKSIQMKRKLEDVIAIPVSSWMRLPMNSVDVGVAMATFNNFSLRSEQYKLY